VSSPYDPQQPYSPYPYGYGQPSSPQAGYQPPNYVPPAGYSQWTPPTQPERPRRPGVLIAAGVLWLLNGAFLLFFGIITMLADRFPGFDEAMRDQGLNITRDQLLAIGGGTAAIGLVLIGLAIPVFNGVTWARILIVVVAVVPSVLLITLVIFPLFSLIGGILQFLPPANRYAQARSRR
jgi:hypothetical protein